MKLLWFPLTLSPWLNILYIFTFERCSGSLREISVEQAVQTKSVKVAIHQLSRYRLLLLRYQIRLTGS